jgi:hypothetical protein
VPKQIRVARGRLNLWRNFGCPGFLQIVVLSAIVFRFQLTGQAQTYAYQFTTSINGSFQQGAADPNPYTLNWGGIGNIFDFGTLSETVYYNSTANTLQQVGSFTLDSTGFAGSFEDNETVCGKLIPAIVSVSYTLNNGNPVVSFNSGAQSIGANPTLDWSIPFSETITLMTGGQDYVDTISGTIPEANDITSVSGFSPNSIVISQGYQNISMNIGDEYSVNFDAADGWSGSIYDGIGDGFLNYTYYVPPTTALAVPEPDSLMILVLGALGLKVFVSRRGH